MPPPFVYEGPAVAVLLRSIDDFIPVKMGFITVNFHLTVNLFHALSSVLYTTSESGSQCSRCQRREAEQLKVLDLSRLSLADY